MQKAVRNKPFAPPVHGIQKCDRRHKLQLARWLLRGASNAVRAPNSFTSNGDQFLKLICAGESKPVKSLAKLESLVKGLTN